MIDGNIHYIIQMKEKKCYKVQTNDQISHSFNLLMQM